MSKLDPFTPEERAEWERRNHATRKHAGTIATVDYLAWVACQIRLDGGYHPDIWKGAIEARDRFNRDPVGDSRTALDIEHAYAILIYFRGQSADEALTPHLADLITCLNKEKIRRDELALAASGALVYQRAEERKMRGELDAKRRETSRHVGARGQEISILAGYITSHRARPSPHTGLVHIYDIQDAAGNAYTWFANRRDLEPGWMYDLLAVVKRHEEYRGIQKTIVGNVRIARVVAEGSK